MAVLGRSAVFLFPPDGEGGVGGWVGGDGDIDEGRIRIGGGGRRGGGGGAGGGGGRKMKVKVGPRPKLWDVHLSFADGRSSNHSNITKSKENKEKNKEEKEKGRGDDEWKSWRDLKVSLFFIDC